VTAPAKSLARFPKRSSHASGISGGMNITSAFTTATFTPRKLGTSTFTSSIFLLCPVVVCADAVTDWNEIMQTTAAAAPSAMTDPAVAGRSAAIVQLAVFDAVNSILGEYEPYLGRIPAPSDASAEAAAIAAAHRALRSLYPDAATTLDAARAASLAVIPDGPSKSDGIAVGEAAADAILTLRADDGFDIVVPYTPGTRPGEYRPTPPELIPAYRPGLGQVATFGIKNGRQFRVNPPPPPHSNAYARAYDDVKQAGSANSSSRAPDRADVARFYAATDADGIYYPAARQLAAEQGTSLSENARIFALLAMAVWDGAVACFESKYHYNVWRPVTAIREGGTDGNRKTDPDPAWAPFVFTPPFPSYPSGHASFGGAARAVLEHEFGDDGHSITLTNPALPEVVLHYTSFKAITDDIDDGRVFGGVHYRFDQEAGARQGKRVGEYILRHELRPVRERKGGSDKKQTANGQ
jgi:hypothetical protein